ncbi:Toxic anion resistance protein (TelA), partial [Rhizobium ruizarguesonis]
MSEPSASNTTTLKTGQGLMPAISTGSLPAVVTVILPPEKAGEVSELAERYRLATAEPHTLITFGQEAIGGFGAKLDAILSQITNAQSPVL